MPKVAQLVSRNTALIEAVEKFSQPLHNLQLEIRRDCLDVLSQVQREDISVYIFHLPDHENLQEMAQVVKKVTSSSQAVVLVVSSEYQDDLAVTLLRAGATDYFGIKTDLCKLRNSLEMVSRAGFCDGSKIKLSAGVLEQRPILLLTFYRRKWSR
jgi:PleD family two-component response regulator